MQNIYRKQVDLLLRILPYVAKVDYFALKGGTAINLFEQGMPRMSVDIDLCYTQFSERATAIKNIHDGLGQIKSAVEKTASNISVSYLSQTHGEDVKLICRSSDAEIKVEVNTINRGHIFALREMDIHPIVEEEFQKFVSLKVLAHEELWGGKICAALDRQHPRDIFDVAQLIKQKGISEKIKQGFIIALLGHGRPIHEIINPNLVEHKKTFDKQFSGMTKEHFGYSEYEYIKKTFFKKIRTLLTERDKDFLISFVAGNPKWQLFPMQNISELSAVKWKMLNLQKLKKLNRTKFKLQIDLLKNTFERYNRALSR